MDSKRRLEEIFAHFPGIGPRQAKRFVYYIQSRSAATVKELSDLIEEVRRATGECSECHRFFIETNHKSAVCSICSDTSRDRSLLMIVARDSDFETVEKSGAYRGLYFILGGTVPVLDKDPEKRIRLKQLMQKLSKNEPAEVILSLSATPDGENTVEVLKRAFSSAKGARVSILGRGLSTGAELEYVDSDTIKNALENRH